MKKGKHLFPVLFFLLIFSNENSLAQHSHARTVDNDPVTRKLVDFFPNYSIEATVIPESLLVRGKVELHFRNLSGDTLDEVYFDLGYNSYLPGEMPQLVNLKYDSLQSKKLNQLKHGYCRIDTLLYNVARLKKNPVMLDSSLIKVFLPSAIVPGEEGFFILVFETRVSGNIPFKNFNQNPILFSSWFPQICLYSNQRWFLDKDLLTGKRPSDCASYHIKLSVDSTFTIFGAGHLLNEKELYGFIPAVAEDSLSIDILNQALEYEPGKIYKPTFEKGYKKYYWRTEGVTTFPFMPGKKFLVDRMLVDDVLLETVYQSKHSRLWQEYTAYTAGQLINYYRNQLGVFPYREVTIMAGGDIFENVSSRTYIIVPDKINTPELLFVHLAVELAHSWFGETLPEEQKDGWLDETLSVYTAWRMLYNRYGKDGYRLAEEYEQVVTDGISKHEISEEACDYIYRTLPAQMYMLRFCTGDSDIAEIFRNYSQKTAYRVTPADSFHKIVNEITGKDYGWYFDQWRQPKAFVDYHFDDKPQIISEAGLVSVSGRIANDGDLLVPLEIGFVLSHTDTLYDTINYQRYETDSIRFTKILEQKPIAIILDPNHYLLDINRSNNYYFMGPTRFRYFTPADLFPAYQPK